MEKGVLYQQIWSARTYFEYELQEIHKYQILLILGTIFVRGEKSQNSFCALSGRISIWAPHESATFLAFKSYNFRYEIGISSQIYHTFLPHSNFSIDKEKWNGNLKGKGDYFTAQHEKRERNLIYCLPMSTTNWTLN